MCMHDSLFVLQLFPELEHCVGLKTTLGFLPLEPFVEAFKDETEAKTLHIYWNSQVSALVTNTKVLPYDVHQLLILRSSYGDRLYQTILKGFREARVALKTGHHGKPWNVEEDREASLQNKPSSALLYGLIAFDSSPDREQGSKWYIRKEEWPLDSYPPWAHGPGYIISQDMAKFVVKGHRERDLRLFKLEDVAMGIWIQQYNQTVKRVKYMNDKRFHNSGCKPNYILVHYQTPRLVLCLWEKLQKESQSVCCE